jgi:hypothetical protein
MGANTFTSQQLNNDFLTLRYHVSTYKKGTENTKKERKRKRWELTSPKE